MRLCRLHAVWEQGVPDERAATRQLHATLELSP